MLRWLLFALAMDAAAITPAAALQAQASKLASSASPYEPVAWLIGDWIADEGGNRIRQTFRWGPKESYLMYSTYTAMNGRPEALHFEGIVVWNAKSSNYDYIFAIEPGSGAQEKGTISVQPDGLVVREVELTAPDGRSARFRQTFKQTGENDAATSLMRETAAGWQPNFPGSDRIEMKRKPAG